MESLKSAVYGFESLTLSGNDPQQTAHKSLVITDYSSALSPASQPGRALWPHVIVGCAFITFLFNSDMSLQYHPLFSSWFSLVQLCQQCCLCSWVVMQMWELIPLKKKTKTFALSVRLVFKLYRSLLQFTVLLAVAQGSSTAKEDRAGPNTTV